MQGFGADDPQLARVMNDDDGLEGIELEEQVIVVSPGVAKTAKWTLRLAAFLVLVLAAGALARLAWALLLLGWSA